MINESIVKEFFNIIKPVIDKTLQADKFGHVLIDVVYQSFDENGFYDIETDNITIRFNNIKPTQSYPYSMNFTYDEILREVRKNRIKTILKD